MKIEKQKIEYFFDNNSRRIIITILIILLILASAFLVGRYLIRKPVPPDSDDNAPISDNRDISGLTAVTLHSGKFKVGKDIKPGRYIATTGKHSFGVLTIYEVKRNIPEFSTSLGYFSETSYINSVTITLKKEQIIEVEMLPSVTFTPIATELKTELTTGIWIVGLDIEAGTYSVASKEGLSGSIRITKDEQPVAEEEIGKYKNTEEIRTAVLTLKRRETIRIMQMPTVTFQKIVR